MLVDLIVENSSVGIFEFLSINLLSFKLFLGVYFSLLLTPKLFSLSLFLILLSNHSHLTHVLAVNLILLSYGSFLVCQVALLVRPKRIISNLRVCRACGNAAPRTLPRSNFRDTLVSSKTVFFACNCGLIAWYAVLMEGLSDNAVTEMFYPTDTIKNINLSIIYSTSKLGQASIYWLLWKGWLLFLHVLILYLNRRFFELLWRCIKRFSDLLVLFVEILWVVDELTLTSLYSHHALLALGIDSHFHRTASRFRSFCRYMAHIIC